jgi:hypothetical protein
MEDIQNFIELNENKNTTYQNLCNAAKIVLIEFIAMRTYSKKL